jgi:hypothetical protein
MGRGATTAAFVLWDYRNWMELSSHHVERARTSGALGPLILSLSLHAFGTAYRGDLESAAALVAEQRAAMDATGARLASYGAPLIAAYRNSRDDASGLTAIDAEFDAAEDGYILQTLAYTSAARNNGLGRYAEVINAAEEFMSYEFAFLMPFVMSELIEAAVRTGKMECAADAMRRPLRTDRLWF